MALLTAYRSTSNFVSVILITNILSYLNYSYEVRETIHKKMVRIESKIEEPLKPSRNQCISSWKKNQMEEQHHNFKRNYWKSRRT
jgi:hypothetical protein